MFSYYGSKANVVNLYPPPRHARLIEPFAGSARYALKYFDREVILMDKYEVIVRIWRWLQQCSPGDIDADKASETLDGDYRELPDDEATWFVDPPYQHGGHKYRHSNRALDFAELAAWCRARRGQVIVCENDKADWMPFYPFATQRGSHKMQHEVIWTNRPTSFTTTQPHLL